MATAAPQNTPDTASNLAPANLLKEEIAQVNQIYNIIIEFFANYTFQLIGAFLIFIIGYIFAGKVSRWVLSLCERHQLDITLSRFLANTTRMLIVIMIVIIALGKLGISVTPFIAAIGAASLGAGLALQGLLANYAAGFNIIIIRPFVVGDTIKVQGVVGVVKEVLLAYTILQDEDGVEIMIPNKHIVGEVLHNSKNDSLLELSVGIAYQHDPLEVVELLQNAFSSQDFVSELRQPQIGIDEFGDSAIVIAVRLWTPTVNQFTSKYQAYKLVYTTLRQHNITIPYPQHDIHIINSGTVEA